MAKPEDEAAPPASLDGPHADLWHGLRAEYPAALGAGERLLLDTVIGLVVRLDHIAEQLTGAELIVPGSTGQDRVHPLLAMEDKLRAELTALRREWGESCRLVAMR